MQNIIVESRQIGQRKSLTPPWEMQVSTLGEFGAWTLRRLIETVVQFEVAAFQQRQADRKLLRVLTERQLQDGQIWGKIDLGGREDAQQVSTEDAAEVALLAFTDGLYYVFVDDQQIEHLNTVVTLKPESRVMFLRLVALAGG